MDLRLLKMFLSVSQSGSFTLAAHRLKKTQSAVSQAIRQLEDELGVVLINRSARPMALTPAGALLQEHASHLIDEAAAITSLVRGHGHTKMQQMRVGLVDSFSAAGGPALMKILLDHAVSLQVWSGLTPGLVDALMQRKVDMVIANDRMDGVDGLLRYELLREPYVLLVPATIAMGPVEVSLPALVRNYPMIRYNPHSCLGAQVERKLRQMHYHVPQRLAVDTTDSLVAMVAAGIGWSITSPLCLLQGRMYLSQVQVLRFPDPQFFRRLILVARRDEYGDLPSTLANISGRILHAEILPELKRMIPWLEDEVTVAADLVT